MKTIITTLLFVGAGFCLLAEISFSELMRRSIEHYQLSDKLAYTIKTQTRSTEGGPTLSEEYIHVFRSGNKQCVQSHESLMICEGETMLTLLLDEGVMVLQERPDSFDIKHAAQMLKMATAWNNESVEELSSHQGNRRYRMTYSDQGDFSAMELEFSKASGLLVASKMILNGSFHLGDETIDNPIIEMEYTNLSDKKLKGLRIEDYINAEGQPMPEYRDYIFYNTIKK